MKFRYPVSSSMRNRAAADGRSRGSFCVVVDTAVLVTDSASHPAAGAKRGLPGRVRRRDPPGVRWRPGDWHAPPTGYLQEATRDTRGPDDGACAGLGYARQPRPRPCSPRSRPAQARRGRAGRAGGQRPAAALRGGRRAGSARTPSASASVRLREAQAVTAALAGPDRRQARVDQTLIRARPLRRRAARIARPARVRMRSRNPCVFARRRLFGWNVRLLTWDSRWTERGRRGHRASHAGRAHAEARPGDSRTNERYAGRVPPVKPAPACCPGVLPGQHAAACSSLHNPGGSSSNGAGTLRNTSRLPNEHRSRALGCGQRFRARGSGIGTPPGSHSPRRQWGGCRTKCNVHNLWKNLLIICGGAR
jgi:hypothetical protein